MTEERDYQSGRVEDFTSAQIDQMERLYCRGVSLDNIGRAFGCAANTVRRRLVARGVAIRESEWKLNAGAREERAPDHYSGPDLELTNAQQFAHAHSALYPDPAVRRWAYARFLAWYRAWEERR